GVLFRKASEQKIRQTLLEMDLLEAVIGLGANIFYGTQLAACVLVFKQQKVAEKQNKVLFIDASDQIRVGRAQNFLDKEHVQQIFDWYSSYTDVENYVKVVDMHQIKENDFYLNIPLYIDKVIEDNLPSVDEAMAQLKSAWKESQQADEYFKTKLAKYIA
ncbi:MAG: N-6 DNA methylase, partial [Sphingobacterium sp.]